jgi:hypothetical protein
MIEVTYRQPVRRKIATTRTWAATIRVHAGPARSFRHLRYSQEWLDQRTAQVRNKMINLFGYNQQSAQDVMEHVAALLARG